VFSRQSRSPSDADLVRKAQTEGIRLPSDLESAASSQLQRLPPQVVEEAIILSEMLNLTEISALQLLVRGEEQLGDYPGLSRGLVAVLLYYDGRKSLVQSLWTMIQARNGLTWTMELAREVEELVANFTSLLVEEGMVEKILSKCWD
jgi:nuclear pore complex protein Nup205